MAKVNFYKVLFLPETLNPNSFYLIENNDYAEFYVTNNSGHPRKVGNTDMISNITKSLISEVQLKIVNNINERDLLITNEHPFFVLVKNAKEDINVTSDGALYAWDGSNNEYLNVANIIKEQPQAIDGGVLNDSGEL